MGFLSDSFGAANFQVPDGSANNAFRAVWLMPCLNNRVKHSILLSLALVSTAWGQVNIQQIVRESIENYGHDWREEMNWAWTQTDVTASDDTNETDVSEIAPDRRNSL